MRTVKATINGDHARVVTAVKEMFQFAARRLPARSVPGRRQEGLTCRQYLHVKKAGLRLSPEHNIAVASDGVLPEVWLHLEILVHHLCRNVNAFHLHVVVVI